MNDKHVNVPEPTVEELDTIRDKMLGFIFPNNPVTDSEIAVFEKAVRYQYAHEATQAIQANGLPNGVESFKIGDFSMSFGDGYNDGRLTKKTICPSAYSLLLREGLLYKGVEGRR